MAFLLPLALLGLLALAVPVLVHLAQRERRQVVPFPSLMFVPRAPFASDRRRRLRHWPLLLLRALALLLIVTAFARPYLTGATHAAGTLAGARDVVILLDQSASMGYGSRWRDAQAAARRRVDALGPADHGTLVLFSQTVEERVRATTDHARLLDAIDGARVTDDSTRIGPALALAARIASESPRAQTEIVLISDLQRTGWTGLDDVTLPTGTTLTTVRIGNDDAAENRAVVAITAVRTTAAGHVEATVTAALLQSGAATASTVDVALQVDGRTVATQSASLPAGAAGSVTFPPFTLPSRETAVRVAFVTADALPADDAADLIVRPDVPVPVRIVSDGDRPSPFLSAALAVGGAPTWSLIATPATALTPAVLADTAVLILNDAALPRGLALTDLETFVRRGGGLVVVAGAHSLWPLADRVLLPGTLGRLVDRTDGRPARIAVRDEQHPIFSPFRAPGTGDLTAAQVFRYRAFAPAPDAQVLARFDDGGIALAERPVGEGRVLVMTTSVDDTWTDLPRRPVYLPLVHQLLRHAARTTPTPGASTVGDTINLTAALGTAADRLVLTPSGASREVSARDGVLTLDARGVYDIRLASRPSVAGRRWAATISASESDLTAVDAAALQNVISRRPAGVAGPSPTAATVPSDVERPQRLWWWLLAAGLTLLAVELLLANHLSRTARPIGGD